jgi:hypothetical protein
VATCEKSFAVRSNAKRHLRTHGIYSLPDPRVPGSVAQQFNVGFQIPQVTNVPDVVPLPQRLRWIPQNLTTRGDVEWQKTSSPSDSEQDDEGQFDASFPMSFPSHSASPHASSENEFYEDRNSYLDPGNHAYRVHPLESRGNVNLTNG